MQVVIASAVLLCLVAGAAARTCICGAPSGGGEVNVRSCASTSCSIVGVINPGNCYDYQATEGEWYRITFNGATAYSHSDYLSAPHTCGGGSYCTSILCSSFSTNQKRACDSYGCGNYGASRSGGTHKGWDVKCNGGAVVNAPFDGVVQRKAYPYGDGSCCDTGFLITGSGQFSGHSVMIFYCEPNRVTMPATVSKGQPVATHKGLHCGCYGTGMTDHIHYQLDYNGVRIDPASFLFC
jgi:uncharacterized protein YraI